MNTLAPCEMENFLSIFMHCETVIANEYNPIGTQFCLLLNIKCEIKGILQNVPIRNYDEV